MDLEQKVDLLVNGAEYDVCSVQRAGPVRPDRTGSPGYSPFDVTRWITPVIRADGRPLPVLKILLTNACQKDCYYCGTRAGRDFRRVAFQPDELARLFDQLYRAGAVQGLFLSSGVVGQGDYTQERMVAVAEILRTRYDFRGYIHLKLMPHASPAAVEQAMRLADRVSVNLEAPTPERLARLTSAKNLNVDLLAPLRAAKAIAEAQGSRVSRTTQFVVGPAGESDRELLTCSQQLYRELGLARAYYSAFRPVPDTPLEDLPPTPLIRQHRLYQADFLLRQYGFSADELPFDQDGNLPATQDPKLLWALRHPERFPVEINRAGRHELLRVPGIGPRSTERIVAARRQERLRSLGALSALGVDTRRAAPFVLLDGRRPPLQLELWEAGSPAG